MKIFEILDEENKISIGILIYYEKSKSFIIELREYLDEWMAPVIFSNYVKKGIYTISVEDSLLWVKERIIPAGRQNISDILNNHKLKEYDEIHFLELSSGRCSQDALYIKKIDNLPEFVVERNRRNISEVVSVNDNTLLCFFNDDTCKKITISDMVDIDEVAKIKSNTLLFNSAKVGVGGYSVSFDDTVEVKALDIYNRGELIPVSLGDIRNLVSNVICDTTLCCEILGCSRQNLSYMIKQGQLSPVHEDVKGNLYFRADVERCKW